MLTSSDVNFDSLQKTAIYETNPIGLEVIILYNESDKIPVNVGTYFVEASIDEKNYTGTATSLFEISKAEAEISISSKEFIYDGYEKEVSISISPSNVDLAVTYKGKTDLPVDAGTYVVEAQVIDQNYFGVATDTLIINKSNQEILWSQDLNSLTIGQEIQLEAISNSGLEIAYSSDNADIVEINGTILKVVGIGQATIAALQEGNDNYFETSTTKMVNTDASGTESITDNRCNIRLWPNPVIDVLHIVTEGNELTEIRLYNQSGVLVIHEYVVSTNPVVDLAELSQGIYLIQLIVNNMSNTVKIFKR